MGVLPDSLMSVPKQHLSGAHLMSWDHIALRHAWLLLFCLTRVGQYLKSTPR